MNIENIDTLYLLLICNCLLVAAATITILRLQRLVNQRGTPLEHPTGTVSKVQSESDNFIKAVERRFADLENGVGNLSRESEPSASVSRSIPHENAVRMAKHGATVDDLTRSCGLSDIEARLLMRVHGNPTVAAKVH